MTSTTSLPTLGVNWQTVSAAQYADILRQSSTDKAERTTLSKIVSHGVVSEAA